MFSLDTRETFSFHSVVRTKQSATTSSVNDGPETTVGLPRPVVVEPGIWEVEDKETDDYLHTIQDTPSYGNKEGLLGSSFDLQTFVTL